MSSDWQPKLPAEVDALICRADQRVSQQRRKIDIKMYAGGLCAKFDQARYCLRKIKELQGSDSADIDINTVAFYCDAFWSLCWTTLDMLGQVINHTDRLGHAEDKATFHKAVDNLNSASSPLAPTLLSWKRTQWFKRIKGYRNCAIHRRPVFVWCKKEEIEVNDPYQDATGPRVSRRLYTSQHNVPKKEPPNRTWLELIPRCQHTITKLDVAVASVLRADA